MKDTRPLNHVDISCPKCDQSVHFALDDRSLPMTDELVCPSCGADLKEVFAKTLVRQDLIRHKRNRKKLTWSLVLNFIVALYLLVHIVNGWPGKPLVVILFIINLIILSFFTYFRIKTGQIIKNLEGIQNKFHL